jgi:hypothetical protein
MNECKSPEKVEKDMAASSLSNGDKQTAGELFADVQWRKMASGRDEERICLPPAQMLDEFQFRGGKRVDKFAGVLGIAGNDARRPREITHLIMESTPGLKDHTLKAEAALKAGDPSIKDRNIIGIWLPKNESASFAPEKAVLHPESDRVEVGQMHSYMSLVNRDFERAASLSKDVKEDGGKPLSVITPMLINPYHIPLSGVEAEKTPFAITADELGITPITPENKDDIRNRDALLSGLHRLAGRGDYRAQSILDSVAAIQKLADTGAQVYLSQTNEDKFELTSYLSAFHPNVHSVTSLDRHGKQAYYNEHSGAFARDRGKGTLVGVPAELDSKLDLSDLKEAVLVRPMTDSPLVGAELPAVSFSEPEFESFSGQIKKYTEANALAGVDEMLSLGRGQLRNEGEVEPFVVANLSSNWQAIQRITAQAESKEALPAAGDEAGKEAYIRKLLSDPRRIESLREAADSLKTAILATAGRKIEAGNSTESPPDVFERHFQINRAVNNWSNELDETVSKHVFSAQQFDKLVSSISNSSRKPRLSRGDRNLYYTSEDLTFSHMSSYLAVPARDGRTLTLPSDSGNSYAAPHAAGLRSRLERRQ